MNMSVIKNIKSNLNTISYKKFFSLSIMSCSIVSLLNFQFLNDTGKANLFDFIFIVFCGPDINEKNLFVCFEWMFTNLIVLSLFSNISFNQIFERGSLVISRAKSRSNLWLSQIVSLSIMIMGYFIIQFLIVISIAIVSYPINTNEPINLIKEIYNIDVNINSLKIIIWLFVLITLSAISIILFQSVLSLILKNSVIALVITIIVQSFALNSGKISIKIIRWLPGNQGILLRHDMFSSSNIGFSITWSIVYSLIFIFILSLIGFFYIKDLDIY